MTPGKSLLFSASLLVAVSGGSFLFSEEIHPSPASPVPAGPAIEVVPSSAAAEGSAQAPADETLCDVSDEEDQMAEIIERRGSGAIQVVKYDDGTWSLLVDGKPYLVKGIEYSADLVGRRPQGSTDWMGDDLNKNLLCDGPFDSWIDANRDNYQDPDEQNVGDFQLLKEMGCNTIRIYHHEGVDKELLRELYGKFGIRVIMGNLCGAYTVGSGAEWSCGTDYADPAQRAAMKENVLAMVREHKDEPYVLMWMLGNENDTVGSYENSTYNNTNACVQPEVYASFIGELCREIKAIDPKHPVGVCNARYVLLPYYRTLAPEIDVIGMNAYNGPFGFGTLWSRVQGYFDRPVLITEYGCDAYDQKKQAVNEEYQANYHRKAWKDIVANGAESDDGAGNAIGGIIFGWLDKWWLCGSAKDHDTELGGWPGSTIDGVFNDEWLGICGQGNGSRSPFIRQLRKAYFTYRDELWNPGFSAAGAEDEKTDETGEP